MRALLLAAFLAPCAAFAADSGGAPVDWNRLESPLSEDEAAGLRRLGFRLEADGRVLDLELRALDAAGLAEARRRLALGERRQRLERLRVLLAAQPQDAPLGAGARAQALALAEGGPLRAAIERGQATAAALGRLAGLDLSAVAKVFDGGDGRVGIAVAAPESPTPQRPLYPYLTRSEQQAGEAMRAAAVTRLSQFERGRLILSRLNGPDGRPDLPPITVEASDTPAKYDPVRRLVVIDREAAVTELLVGTLPVDRAARRRALAQPDALAAALAADPGAVSRLVTHNDVLIAHELTHAWQDRRDPVWSRMRRELIPQGVPFEYEEEANLEKNLYIHDVLRSAPGTEIDARELEDYRRMMTSYIFWRNQLADRYGDTTRLSELESMVRLRRESVAAMPANTEQERLSKARALSRLSRSSRALAAVQAAHETRIREAQNGPIAAAGREGNSVMALHYLEVAATTFDVVQRAVALDKARRYAEASGDAALIERVQSQLGRSR